MGKPLTFKPAAVDFKLDLQRNFWTLETLRYPATVKWMQDDYDENRAILDKLGLLQ